MQKKHRNVESCPHGHKFTEENTYIQPSTGWRFCLTCKKAREKAYRETNRDRLNAKTRKWHQENKARVSQHHKNAYKKIRLVLEAAKNKPCADCEQSYPHYVMDFDHVRGKKLFNVGVSKHLGTILAEIEKCDVVCANCHRERTHRRKQFGRPSTIA